MFQANKYLIDDEKKIKKNIEKISGEINDILEINESKNILLTINQLLINEGLETINSIEKLEDCVNKLNELSKSSDNELITTLAIF